MNIRVRAHTHTHTNTHTHTHTHVQVRADKDHLAREADRLQNEGVRLRSDLSKSMKVGAA